MVSRQTDRIAEFQINRVIIGLTGLLLFGIPHVIHRSIYYTAVNAKYFFSELLILVIYGIWILSFLWFNPKVKKSPVQVPLLVFLVYLLLRIIFHPLPLVGLNESLPWILGISLSLVLLQTIETEKETLFLVGCIMAGAVLSAVHGIFQYYGMEIPILVWKGKPQVGTYVVIGTLGNANFMAEYLLPVLLLTLCCFTFSFTNKWVTVVGLVSGWPMAFCIWLTGANEVWVILPFIGIIFLILIFPIVRNRAKLLVKIIFPVVVLIIISIFLAKPSPNWRLLKNQYRLVVDRNTYSDRLMVWEIANKMIIEKPVFGWGMGEFRISYLQELAGFLRVPENEGFTDSAKSTQGANANQTHDDYLQMTTDLGIVGTGIFLWIIVVFFWTMFKQYQKEQEWKKKIQAVGWMISVVVILLDAVMNFPLFLPVTCLLFWTFLGMASSPLLSIAPPFSQTLSPIRLIIGRTGGVIIVIMIFMLGIHTWHRIIASQSLKEGMALVPQKKWKEADLKLQKSIYYDPTVGEAYLRRTYVLLELNQTKEAVRDAFLAFQYGTGDVERYYVLAKTILQNGEPQRTIEILNSATIIYPDYGDAYRLQAQIYGDILHHPVQAIQCWQKYMATGISDEEKKKAQQEINKLQEKL